MYHLLSGLYEYLTRKEEFGVLILGLDGAGKTVRSSTSQRLVNLHLIEASFCSQTLLEAIKSQYNHTAPLPPSKIAPTVGQNSELVDCGTEWNLIVLHPVAGKITLPSTILKFWDLG